MIIDTNQSAVNLTDIRGLICIDCWEDPELDDYYQTLCKTINFAQFDSIVVANYEIELSADDVSLTNTLHQYSWNNYTPAVLLPVVKETRQRKTSRYLQQHFNEKSFLLLDTASFEIHVEQCVSHITDWLVIGGWWQYCSHVRPIGFCKLAKLDYNFYTADNLIYHKELGNLNRQMIEQDYLQWIDCTQGLYQLKHDPR